MPSRKHSASLRQWLDQMISQPVGSGQLISKNSIDFTDERVREFTEDEMNKNRAFLDVSSQIAEMKYILKVISACIEY
jgi:hypothetical protein